MNTIQLIWLALVQGLTEFLPVSSSGHLILFARFSSFPDQGIAIDIALHIGSLLAVLVYFRATFLLMIKSVMKNYFMPDFTNQGNRLAWFLVFASLPALFFGFLLRNSGMEWARNPVLIGGTILFYGFILYLSDKYGATSKQISDLTLTDALLIGFAQCLALIPGTSRSGITITMARFLGVNRQEAAKFSMLLSVPTILAAGLLEGYRMYVRGSTAELLWAADAVLYSFAASFLEI